jgi:hypothetical protein
MNDTKGLSRKKNSQVAVPAERLEMPVLMNVSRSALSRLRFCQAASSIRAAANCVLSQPRFRTAIPSEAIGMPHICGKADGILDSSKNAPARVKATLRMNPLTALCALLFIALSSAMASAQTTTTTTLAVTPSIAANGDGSRNGHLPRYLQQRHAGPRHRPGTVRERHKGHRSSAPTTRWNRNAFHRCYLQCAQNFFKQCLNDSKRNH